MAKRAGTNRDLLAMALIGYEGELGKINAAIAEIGAKLGRHAAGSDGQPTEKKRTMSAAARRRIAAAQRKRWAAVKKAKSERPKRQLNAAARKRIALGQKKRWAAQRKASVKNMKASAKVTTS